MKVLQVVDGDGGELGLRSRGDEEEEEKGVSRFRPLRSMTWC